MATPFEILRVDPEATDEEIEQAYRSRIKQAHPDHGGSAREFQRVKTAYEDLQSGAYSLTDIPDPTARSPEPTEPEPKTVTVEYLNYEILEDYGWELTDPELFAKAGEQSLEPEDYGRFAAEPGETLLEAAENRGFAWPYACRGGACANCAVAVIDGELATSLNDILPTEMLERGIDLSCVGSPVSGDMQVVYNLKHLPELEELRLPPRPFEQAYAND